MMSNFTRLLVLVVAITVPLFADEVVDEQMVARFKVEGFQHSQVMDTLGELTDVYGARLRGSPGRGRSGSQACRREDFGTLASRNSIWSTRMRRPRRIMSSCRLGT